MAWCRIVRGAGGAIVRIGLNNSLNYSLLKGREILELRERLPSWPLGGNLSRLGAGCSMVSHAF